VAEVYFLASRGQGVRLITQLPFNAVVESEWRYASMSQLRNYIFRRGDALQKLIFI
jgi:hypothetical protein